MAIDGNLGSAWTWGTCTPTTSSICNSLSTSHGSSRDSGNGDSGIGLSATNYLTDPPKGIFDIKQGNVCLLVAECIGSFAFNVEKAGSIAFSSLVFTTQDVPEPSTWALMIVGFLAVGQSLRFCQGRGGRIRLSISRVVP